MLMLCLVTQSCDPIDCSPPGPSVHGDCPGKNTGANCHALLQEIFSTQGSNSGLLHCRWILYHLNHQGSPILVTKPNNCFFQFFLIRMQASREQELCSIYLFKSSA